MSRLLMGLGVFGLTVALISIVGADEDAAAPTGAFRHPQIIRVAKKIPKSKKKAMAKKGEGDDAEKEMTKDATEKPAAKSGPAVSEEKGIVFSRDVAPIFVANCLKCHGEKEKKESDFDLSTFERLMKTGAVGNAVVPGKPDESDLILRINGGEPRKKKRKMPPGNRDNLGESAIARITEWVKNGAKLDKDKDAKAPIASYAPTVDQMRKLELAKATPEERDKIVEASGLERWKKGAPKVKPEITPSKNFLLFSGLPKHRADATVKVMETQLAQLKALLGPKPFDTPLKISLLVFNDKSSFVEFARGYEGREVEPEDAGSAKFEGLEPYVAVVDPLHGGEEAAAPKKSARAKKGDEEGPVTDRTLPGILTEQLTIGAAGKAGKPPRWLTAGLGAYLESRVERNSPYIMKLRRDAWDLCDQGWTTKAVEAMGDGTKPEDVRAVGYAIVDWLGSVAKPSLPAFVRGLAEGGEKLDDVVANVFGNSRDQFLAGSGEYIMSTYRK